MQYQEAEQHLFNTMCPILRGYAHLNPEELRDVAYARALSIVEEIGAWDHFSYRSIEKKTLRWADWWSHWHQRGRGCVFTKEQTLIGQVRGLLTQRRNALVRAYYTHLLHQAGHTYRRIAALLRCSIGTVSNDLKRSWSYLQILFNPVSGEGGIINSSINRTTRTRPPVEQTPHLSTNSSQEVDHVQGQEGPRPIRPDVKHKPTTHPKFP